MMPGTNGADVFRAIEIEAPAMARRFVFMTGGSFTTTLQEFLDTTACPVLTKPLERVGLEEALESICKDGADDLET
jgi:CheY-like chemotaxis protein